MNTKTLSWLAAGLAAAWSLPLPAAQSAPVNQLGQARPAVPDVSGNPHWHVYRFQRDGIDYLQVNALDDQPRLAVAAARGTVLVLPIGHDANRVTVLSSNLQQTPAIDHKMTVACNCAHMQLNQSKPLQAKVESVYQDANVQIQAVPGPGGDAWQVDTLPAP